MANIQKNNDGMFLISQSISNFCLSKALKIQRPYKISFENSCVEIRFHKRRISKHLLTAQSIAK